LVIYAKKQRIDVIHTHGKGAGLYGRIVSALTKKPCLHTPHGVHVSQYGVFAMWAYRLYENLSAKETLVATCSVKRDSQRRGCRCGRKQMFDARCCACVPSS